MSARVIGIDLLPLCDLERRAANGRYPLRICRTLHECAICNGPIICGQRYYDGGYSRRLHKTCVDRRAEPSTTAPAAPVEAEEPREERNASHDR